MAVGKLFMPFIDLGNEILLGFHLKQSLTRILYPKEKICNTYNQTLPCKVENTE